MLFVKHPFVRQNRTGSVGRLSTLVQPIKRFIEIQIDSCRVGIWIIRANTLNKFTVTRCARIGHYYVVERFSLFTVSLQSNFNCHSSLTDYVFNIVPGSAMLRGCKDNQLFEQLSGRVFYFSVGPTDRSQSASGNYLFSASRGSPSRKVPRTLSFAGILRYLAVHRYLLSLS